MKKIISNYHTHTFRCGHANDYKDEEYVKEAIASSFKILGFSDHAPFENVKDPKIRMDFSLLKDYIESIQSLKKKYKDQIEIKLGLEVEYMKEKDSYYQSLLNEYKFDYLILGQHCKFNKNNKTEIYFKNVDNIEEIERYKNDLILGMNSNYFKYVCHPDLFMINITKMSEQINQITKEICLEAKRLNIPLEINLHGLYRYQTKYKEKGVLFYPSIDFFKIAHQVGNEFIIGIDAHNPNEISNINYQYLDYFFKETNILPSEIIDVLDI